MNYFSFLDHPDKSLEASIELFNRPPMNLFSEQNKEHKKIYLFYIENEKWKNIQFDTIQYNKSKIIKKRDIPLNLQNKTVFVTMTSRTLKSNASPFNDKSMQSIPSWRSNIKIYNQNTSTSYQGEIPGSFLNLNLSLTSCSPFLQFEDKIENYFYLVNFNADPVLKKFELEVLDTNKNLLSILICKTNHVNIFNLNFLKKNYSDHMYIFRSKNYGHPCISPEHQIINLSL